MPASPTTTSPRPVLFSLVASSPESGSLEFLLTWGWVPGTGQAQGQKPEGPEKCWGCRTECESSQGYFPHRLPSSWLQLALFPPSPTSQDTVCPHTVFQALTCECSTHTHTQTLLGLILNRLGEKSTVNNSPALLHTIKTTPNLITPPHKGTSQILARGSPVTLRGPGQQGTGPG